MAEKTKQKRPVFYMVKLVLMGPSLIGLGLLFLLAPPADLAEELPDLYAPIAISMIVFGVSCIFAFFSTGFHSLFLAVLFGGITLGALYWLVSASDLNFGQIAMSLLVGGTTGVGAVVCFIAAFTNHNPMFKTLKGKSDLEGHMEDMGIDLDL